MTLLNQPLSELTLDLGFLRKASLLGLETLGDIMDADFSSLKQRREFSYLWYADLLNLLKDNDLLGEFQDKLINRQ